MPDSSGRAIESGERPALANAAALGHCAACGVILTDADPAADEQGDRFCAACTAGVSTADHTEELFLPDDADMVAAEPGAIANPAEPDDADAPLVSLAIDADPAGDAYADVDEESADETVTEVEANISATSEAEVVRSGPPAVELPASFTCSRCGGICGADAVYNLGGALVCATCYSNQAPTAAPVVPSPPEVTPPVRRRLLSTVTCPHCWHRFPADQTLWVSQHTDLLGDAVLGPEAPSRFLPSRFTADGDAIDARDMTCHTLACPRCHLVLPRALLESEPLFVSTIGVSASGKSYFATSMVWELRRILAHLFGVSFADADPVMNRALIEYEQTLFLQDDPDRLVKLAKTDIAGEELYDQIRLGQHILSLPKPFLFTLRPARAHPRHAAAEDEARVLCLYDNAGEHFNPGEESSGSPVTQHLARSRAILFLYDPTQDPRFRAACRGLSADPQLEVRGPVKRQETVLLEAGLRLRRYAALPATGPQKRPLLVVVPKADIWGKLIDLDLSSEPIIPGAAGDGRVAAVDTARVEAVSAAVRQLLTVLAPEFVAAADEFSSHVVYIPISALGCSPELRAGHDGFWIRPRDLDPRWVSVPILYMFAKWSHGLIARTTRPVRQVVEPQPTSAS